MVAGALRLHTAEHLRCLHASRSSNVHPVEVLQ